MIVSVFGLRDYRGKEYDDYEHVANVLESFDGIEQIVSGGGMGIEQLAARFGEENAIPVRIIPPNIQKFGSEAFTRRNREIIDASDIPIVFWDGRDGHYVELIKTVIYQRKNCYVVPIG